MRRSREDAAETRRRIVETASRLFRLRGISAVSVADIMGDLGLTVGGFYRHFQSKEALVIEAIAVASDELVATYAAPAGSAAGATPLSELLGRYLSRVHLDHPERGCPVAALCADVAHEDLPTREAFTKSLRCLLEIVAGFVPGDTKDAYDSRLYAVASMVGAVVLSRATSDEALTDDLLRVVRTGLVEDPPRAAGKAPRGQRGPRRSRARSTRAARTPAKPGSTT